MGKNKPAVEEIIVTARQDFITPAYLLVTYLDENGNEFDHDHYDIADRASFLANLLRIHHELSSMKVQGDFNNFAQKLSWARFYSEGWLSFTDYAHAMRYDFRLKDWS